MSTTGPRAGQKAGPTADDLISTLSAALGDDLLKHGAELDGALGIGVSAGAWRAAAEALCGAGVSRLDFLTCVDWDDHFTLTLQTYAMSSRVVVRLTAELPHEDAAVATVSDLYPSAGWEEREAYDLFGIAFDGHPDLRRILNPEAWEGHPLRRDYVDYVDITRPQYF